MDESDSLGEVFEFAIDREIDANQFYLALANCVDDEQMCKVLEDLAGEELEHKAKLELELMKLGKTTAIKEPPASPRRDYILSDGKSLVNMDYKDMLMMAIEKEEASFRTYVDLVPRVHDSESREVLLSLAQEEVSHKLRFQMEYDMVTKHQ